MRSLLPFLCLSLPLAWRGGEGAVDPAMPFAVHLDHDHQVRLEWGFDKIQGNISFRLTVNTTGWVGFGLSPTGTMVGADIVIGGVGPDGAYFSDRHGEGKFMPIVDEQQSYTLRAAAEDEGQTMLLFERTIRACDGDDYDITETPIKLIYAYGLTDVISYHQNRRGTKLVNLLNYMPQSPAPLLGFISATVDNILIPANHTYYHCKVMEFPILSTVHHIYRVDPVIDHPDIVHHMLLYRCPSSVNQTSDGPCYIGAQGDVCFGVVTAWGVGGGVIEMPEFAGLPIGGDANSDTLYRLEIHYNNPHLESGRRDSSGLKLFYTAELREHDVGILSTGVFPFSELDYKIPPKAKDFLTYGMCNTTLFPQLLDSVPDLHMFAVLLHTHLTGRRMRVGRYSDGEQVDFLVTADPYSFELQDIINLGEIKTIKPNDEIAVECTYSTMNRTGITKMGLATTDEMCLAFIYYYPAINITSCTSHPMTHHLAGSEYDLFDNDTLTDEEIKVYERVLNGLDQWQLIVDNKPNSHYQANGFNREMMDTPSITCTNACGLCRPWTMTPAGLLLLLLGTAIM